MNNNTLVTSIILNCDAGLSSNKWGLGSNRIWVSSNVATYPTLAQALLRIQRFFLENNKNPPSEFRENQDFYVSREARRKFWGLFAPENSDFVQNKYFLKRVLLKTPHPNWADFWKY